MASGEKTTALSNTEVEWAERTSQTAAKFKTVRKLNDLDAVSYTHLTLPTIYSV